jgi:hypothetical protein
MDGSMNHAIAIVDNLIFDPNYQYASFLNEANLNKSCGENTSFVRIECGHHYIFRKDYIKENK